LAGATPDGTLTSGAPAPAPGKGPLPGHVANIWGLAFTADGRRLASCGIDGTARIWDAAAGREVALLQHRGPLWTMALSRDDTTLATGTDNLLIQVWDVAAAKSRRTIGSGDGRGQVHALAFSPDGKQLAAGQSTSSAR